MKKIKAIKIWQNGGLKNATKFNLYAVNVSLNNSATFYYSLLNDDNQNLTEGNLSMDGQDYQSWQNDDFAWQWAASKLNIEILAD